MLYPDIHTHSIQDNLWHIHSISLKNDSPNQVEDYFNSGFIPYFSVGIHPWDVAEIIESKTEHLLIQYIAHPQCVAIGECGLDALKSKLNLQLSILRRQIDLAIQLKKPLVLHLVKAWPEWFKLIDSYKFLPPIVVHGFRGNLSIAKQLIDRGINISFGVALLSDSRLQQVFKFIPHDKWFLESDTENSEILSSLFQKAIELRCSALSPELLAINQSDFFHKFLRFIGRNGDSNFVFQK